MFYQIQERCSFSFRTSESSGEYTAPVENQFWKQFSGSTFKDIEYIHLIHKYYDTKHEKHVK